LKHYFVTKKPLKMTHSNILTGLPEKLSMNKPKSELEHDLLQLSGTERSDVASINENFFLCPLSRYDGV
jgi:hypothetical protein